MICVLTAMMLACCPPKTFLSQSSLPPSLKFPFLMQIKPSSSVMEAVSKLAQSAPTVSAKENKLWGGRFEKSVTDCVEKFSESISFDKVLYKQDITGSRAHATMLAHQARNWLV